MFTNYLRIWYIEAYNYSNRPYIMLCVISPIVEIDRLISLIMTYLLITLLMETRFPT